MRPIARLMLPIALMLPTALMMTGAPAQALTIGPSWETNVTLTRGDLDLIRATLNNQIHGRRAGTAATWFNPSSRNSGTIRILQVFMRGGRRCERIEYRMMAPHKTPASDRFALTSCLQPDGSWKLSD